MVIIIERTDPSKKDINLDSSDITGLYTVFSEGKEFKIACIFNQFGNTISLFGERETLHINEETNEVVKQNVKLSDACGINITEEPVSGLSPTALRGVIFAERDRTIKRLVIETF